MEAVLTKALFNSSPAMSEKRTINVKGKYPWRDILPGQSFAVAVGEAKYTTLVSAAHRMGKKWNKRFRVLDHGDRGLEIGCFELIKSE